jgi:hypothetical protein
MPNNSLYDGILMPQGGVYEPGPAVMLPPSAPAKQSAVVRALIASDPNGPGLRDPQSGMAGGWGQMEDFASSGSPSIPGPNGTIIAKDQTRLPGQVAAQFDPVEAYSGVPRNQGQQAIEAFAPRSAAFSPWGPDWTTGIGAVHGGGNSLVQEAGQSPIQGVGQRGEMRKGPDGRQYQYMQLDGANGGNGRWGWLPASGGPLVNGPDPWTNDRFGEPVVQQPGFAYGGGSPVAQALVAANARPITYSAPVAAGNFAEGSPNQSFEKQNGMGSVTKSMAESSRWNTGY